MAVGRSGRRIRVVPGWDSLTRLALLSACFFVGALGGFLFSAAGGGSGELRDYLLRYFQLSGQGLGPQPSLLSAVWDVFRWPLVAFLLGSLSIGVVAIPLLMLARGFVLSFAASTFARLFGLPGATASLACFGVTVLLSVPVLFAVAQSALCDAQERLSDAPLPMGRRLVALAPCGGLLVLAAALQRVVMPALFTAVCARLFQT